MTSNNRTSAWTGSLPGDFDSANDGRVFQDPNSPTTADNVGPIHPFTISRDLDTIYCQGSIGLSDESLIISNRKSLNLIDALQSIG